MAVLSADSFTRANATGWGTASDGEAWSQVAGAGTFAIASNEGTFTGSVAAAIQLLGAKTTADTNLLVRFSQHQTTDSTGFVIRSDATGANAYLVRQAAGAFAISKLVAGVNTNLVSNSFTLVVDTFYFIRFIASGTSLKARIWLAGNAEPATFQDSVTDSTYTAAGQYGTRFVLNATGNTTKIDSLTITDNVPVSAAGAYHRERIYAR